MAFGKDEMFFEFTFNSHCLLKCFYDVIEKNTKVQLLLLVSLKVEDPVTFLAAQRHKERNNEVKGDPAQVKWMRKETGNTGDDSHQSRTGQKDEKNVREKMTGNMMENAE